MLEDMPECHGDADSELMLQLHDIPQVQSTIVLTPQRDGFHVQLGKPMPQTGEEAPMLDGLASSDAAKRHPVVEVPAGTAVHSLLWPGHVPAAGHLKPGEHVVRGVAHAPTDADDGDLQAEVQLEVADLQEYLHSAGEAYLEKSDGDIPIELGMDSMVHARPILFTAVDDSDDDAVYDQMLEQADAQMDRWAQSTYMEEAACIEAVQPPAPLREACHEPGAPMPDSGVEFGECPYTSPLSAAQVMALMAMMRMRGVRPALHFLWQPPSWLPLTDYLVACLLGGVSVHA